MTITPTRARYPVLATPEGLRSTLLDVASVDENSFDAVQAEVGRAQSFNCMKFLGTTTFCNPSDKDFDQSASWVDGVMVVAYGGAICGTVGLDQARMKSEVGRVFDAGESQAVEIGLMENRFVANPSGSGLPGEWAEPTDLTPAGGAVAPRVGVAILEGHASTEYVGRPTIHAPTTIAALLASLAATEWDGDVLRTKFGSKVAAGAGYEATNIGPDGTPAAAGTYWLYATGQVHVAKGPYQLIDAIGRETNEVYVLAERPYIVTVDCYTAAVQVTLTD